MHMEHIRISSFRSFWKELANRGHNVVLITTDPMKDPTIKNLKEIDLSEAYEKWNSNFMKILNGKNDALAEYKLMVGILYDIARMELSNPEVQALYNSQDEQFDLLIMEYHLPTMFPFKHKFNVPFMGVASLDVPITGHTAVGNPIHNILYPNDVISSRSDLSFFERVAGTLFDFFVEYWYCMTDITLTFNQIFKDHLGEGIPCVLELGSQMDMLFINAHPVFNVIRPFSPATISIAGGFHETEVKPLPKDLKDFMDKATEGVIYFSLGTNVKSREILQETRNTIMKTFAQLPYKVLWKLPGKPENVKIMKWLPQLDVLRHKHILVFVTQGGLPPLDESLYAKVPVVLMPFFADQHCNARHATTKGLGVTVNHKTLTVDGFKAAIMEVITNDKYQKRVEEIAEQIHDQPMKPLDRAIWWTEYVLRHKGSKHLHRPKLPFYQKFYIDVIVFLSVVGVVLLWVVYYLYRKTFPIWYCLFKMDYIKDQ